MDTLIVVLMLDAYMIVLPSLFIGRALIISGNYYIEFLFDFDVI